MAGVRVRARGGGGGLVRRARLSLMCACACVCVCVRAYDSPECSRAVKEESPAVKVSGQRRIARQVPQYPHV